MSQSQYTLLQRDTKEIHRFPGLMERAGKVPEASPIQPKTPEQAPVEQPAPKKRGRPRKVPVDESAPATRKKGIDTKNAKVL